MVYNEIKTLFGKQDVDIMGVVAIDELMPLLYVASKNRIMSGARSVIVALIPYYVGEMEHNISRYAIPRDYHSVGGGILEEISNILKEKYKLHKFEWFIDASPINEVKAGYLAGLGVVGRNGQLINNIYGSYTFIGTIVTDMEIEKSIPLVLSCLNCGLCERLCPEGALAGGKLNKELCRSHITQKKGVLTAEQEKSIRAGGLAWGCDICTDCCPHNKNPKKSPIKAFYEDLQPIITKDNLDSILADRAYGYKGRAVMERNLGLIR